MLQTMHNSQNPAMKFIAKRSMLCTNGTLGRNLVYVNSILNVNCLRVSSQEVKQLLQSKYECDTETKSCSAFVRELCSIRDNARDMELLTTDEVVSILHELCVN